MKLVQRLWYSALVFTALLSVIGLLIGLLWALTAVPKGIEEDGLFPTLVSVAMIIFWGYAALIGIKTMMKWFKDTWT